MITLARNKMILIDVNLAAQLSIHCLSYSFPKDLDMKSLLLEAYYKGQQELLYVVPFIAKMLESCKSKVLLSVSSSTLRTVLFI